MKKHVVISITLIALSILIPFVTHAAVFSKPTISFGGRVLLTTIPLVTCTGSGTGPVVLLSNLASVASATYSTVPKNGQSAGQKAGGVVNGIYGAIPYYATSDYSRLPFMAKRPQAGDWILGTANMIPEFTTCSIQIANYKVPFPVKDTNKYNTSGNSSF
jgi:hypothetical protein